MKSNNSSNLFVYGDEEFQVLNLNNTKIVLTSLEKFSIGEGTDFGDDYSSLEQISIFAEKLEINSNFKAKNIEISINEFLNRENAIINTSGEDGENYNTPNQSDNKGKNGGNGENGGEIELYLENLNSVKIFPLSLDAMGGNGGEGQRSITSAEGGDGGNGGNGGNIDILYSHPYIRFYEILLKAYKSDIISTKITYLNEFLVSIKKIENSNDIILENGQKLSDGLKELQNLLNKIIKGKPQSDTIDSINSLIKDIAKTLKLEAENWEVEILKPNLNNKGGNYGIYGIGGTNGKNGIDGTNGESELVSFATTLESTKNSPTFPFVHPNQCSMLLQRANLLYFISDKNSENLKETAILLDRLINRTKVFSTLESDSEIAKLYHEKEQSMGTLGSVNTLKDIYNLASNSFRQLKQGHDYYGHPYNYVPMASFKFYNTLLTQLFSNLETIENSYNDYFKNLNDMQKSISSIKNAKTKAKDLVDQAKENINLSKNRATSIAIEINVFQRIILKKKEIVIEKIKIFEELIEKSFSFDLGDFLSTLSVCVAVPESALTFVLDISQTANDLANKQNDADVKNEYVVNKVKGCEATIDKLNEGYRELDDGTLEASDPGANKLITAKDELFSLLEDFYTTFPKELDELKTVFKDYVDTVLERNTKILDYNAVVNLLIKNKNIISDYNNKMEILNEKTLETLKPNFPLLTSFMSKLYLDARSQVMEELYLTAKAYRFWALSNDNLIANTFGNNPPATINLAMLTAAQFKILTSYQKSIESFGRDAQKFPANPNGEGIKYTLEDSYIKELQESNEILFPIAPVKPNTTKEESVFAGLANVRLLKVRVWIEGAKSSDGELQLLISQTGRETIISPSGEEYPFTHNPKIVTFKYNLNDKTIIEDADIGYENEGSSNYALIGPFSWWRVYVNPKWNRNLDLSKVSKITLEFFGTNYSFNK